MPLPPIYDPSLVAEAIVFAAEHPRRDIIVGGAGKLLIGAQRLSPRLLDWYMLQGDRFFERQKTDQPEDGRDNLFAPLEESGSTRGEFGAQTKSTSLSTSLALHPTWQLVLLGVAAVGTVTFLRRSRESLQRGTSIFDRTNRGGLVPFHKMS